MRWQPCDPLTPSAFQKEMSLSTKQRLASTWEMNLPRIVQLLDRSETFHHKDYFHQLLCITDREKFLVLIQAVVLDFPAQLDFSVCPVSPFSVIPAVGTLDTGDTVQVTVEFHPLQTRGSFHLPASAPWHRADPSRCSRCALVAAEHPKLHTADINAVK
ncbi:hypothetical protein BTVI_33794 [Pitangus sulphuratus]|nr:hypothetical protein BTVI_33794 [Pitangus sulphuratus]